MSEINDKYHMIVYPMPNSVRTETGLMASLKRLQDPEQLTLARLVSRETIDTCPFENIIYGVVLSVKGSMELHFSWNPTIPLAENLEIMGQYADQLKGFKLPENKADLFGMPIILQGNSNLQPVGLLYAPDKIDLAERTKGIFARFTNYKNLEINQF